MLGLQGDRIAFLRMKNVISIIIILRHPTNSISRLNFANQNVNIDPIHIEANNHDVCTNFKEAGNSQCIDEIIRSFHNTELWILVVQSYMHMIDTLTGKTNKLIIKENGPGMICWLKE